MAKKRNPQDLTLRNLHALKARVEMLEAASKDFADRLRDLETRVAALENPTPIVVSTESGNPS